MSARPCGLPRASRRASLKRAPPTTLRGDTEEPLWSHHDTLALGEARSPKAGAGVHFVNTRVQKWPQFRISRTQTSKRDDSFEDRDVESKQARHHSMTSLSLSLSAKTFERLSNSLSQRHESEFPGAAYTERRHPHGVDTLFADTDGLRMHYDYTPVETLRECFLIIPLGFMYIEIPYYS